MYSFEKHLRIPFYTTYIYILFVVASTAAADLDKLRLSEAEKYLRGGNTDLDISLERKLMTFSTQRTLRRLENTDSFTACISSAISK